MKQNVDTEVKQQVCGAVVLLSSTGTTVNFGTYKIKYIKTTTFQVMYGVNEKRLERYREKVKNEIKIEDQPRYFLQKDGKYWYTPKILDFIKYRKHLTEKTESVVSKVIKNGNETHRSGIINWMKKKIWNYKCGISYSDSMSFETCSHKMEKLFCFLQSCFPTAKVLIFYVTEENPGRDGHHNHFLVSITGKGLKNKKRAVTDAIKNIGSNRYECEKYQCKKGEDFLHYITKSLEKNPECYWYLTNEDQNAIEANLNPFEAQERQDKQTLNKAA